MRRWLQVLLMLAVVGSALSGCLVSEEDAGGGPATAGTVVSTRGIPTSQPTAISGPPYSAYPLDPLLKSSAGAHAVAVGDLDNDGQLDLASISDESQGVQTHFYNVVTGGFDTITIAGGAPLSFMQAIELADLNSDGKLDIVVLVRDTGFALGDDEQSSAGALVLLIQGEDCRTASDWTQLPPPGTAPPENLSFPNSGDEKTGPVALLVGEMDGQNGPDIVVLNNDEDLKTVSFFANPGADRVSDSAAWTPVTIEMDISDFAAAELGDLDNDGDLDIVISAPQAKSFNLRWLQNPLNQAAAEEPATTPTFTADQVDPLLESTAGATATAAGDVDDDGAIDIVSIHNQSQPVQIHLWNAASGTFDTIALGGASPLASMVDVELADLNRDGKLDIAVLADDTGLAAANGLGLLTLFVQGDNPRKASAWIQVPDPSQPIPRAMTFVGASDLAVGNIDGVNGPDIVVADGGLARQADGVVRLFRNPGDANVTDETAWVPQVIETDVQGLARMELTDLDLDGDRDVVMGDPGANSFNLRWLQNPLVEVAVADEDPAPTYVSDLVDPLFEATAGAKASVIGDIDGDGLDDVASISDENQPVQIHLRNASTGKFDTYSIAGGGPLARMVDIDLGDLNGDGKLDIAVAVNNTGCAPPPAVDRIGGLVLLIQGADPRSPSDWTQVPDTSNRCPGGPNAGSFYFNNNATGVTDLAIGDITNDGRPDVVITSNMPSDPVLPTTFIHLFTNPGPARVAQAAAWTRSNIDESKADFSQLALADVDRDGDLDVVASVPTAVTYNLRWLQNTANGSVWFRRLVGQQEGGAEYIAVADIDEDGNVDVAASSVQFALTQWFRNPGPAIVGAGIEVPWYVFNIGELADTEAKINQVQLADLDGDGHLDCFVTASGVATGFRRQDDVEHVWDLFPIATSDPLADIGRVSFADFDGDGQLDFIAPLNRAGLKEDRLAIYTSVANSRWLRRLIGHQDASPGEAGGGADFLAVGDIDRDGATDVAAASVQGRLAQWFRNPGAAALIPGAPQIPWDVFTIGQLSDTEAQISQLLLEDLDGNGALDGFVTAGGLAIGFIPGGNVEDTWDSFILAVPAPPAAIGRVSFADFGSDGRLDFVAPLDREGLTGDAIVIYTSSSQSGDNRWLRRLVGRQDSGGDFIATGDVDGDGHLDLVSASAAYSLVQWFRNPGPATLLTPGHEIPWDVFNLGDIKVLDGEARISQVRLVDFDGDGALDCYVTAGGSAFGFQRQADVEDWWTPFRIFTTEPVAEIGRTGFGDFNGDGLLDFVAPLDREGLTRDQFMIFIHQ